MDGRVQSGWKDMLIMYCFSGPIHSTYIPLTNVKKSAVHPAPTLSEKNVIMMQKPHIQ